MDTWTWRKFLGTWMGILVYWSFLGGVDAYMKGQFDHAIDLVHSGQLEYARTLLYRMSLVAPEYIDLYVALGAVAQIEGKPDAAIEYYQEALALDPMNDAANGNLGLLLYANMDFHGAIFHLKKAIHSNPSKLPDVAHILGLSYHNVGDDIQAIEYFEVAIQHNESNPQLHFDFGVTLQDEGQVVRASVEYNRAIALDQNFPEAWLNIAALHLKYGDLNSAIRNFERTLNCTNISPQTTFQAIINYGIALEMSGQALEALEKFKRALTISQVIDVSHSYAIYEHITRIHRSVALWQDYEELKDSIVSWTIENHLNRGIDSSITPFSSLLMPISPLLQRRIAEGHATTPKRETNTKVLPTSRLHVGYLSYDYNDHPTAHLMEGLFVHHNKSSYEISALSYGKNDGSRYRERITSLAEHFMELAVLGISSSAQLIASSNVHILVDCQGHTLGHRHEIVARQPAPIIINYLVYPGTLGAKYVDYLVADRFVGPPEHQDHFTEKLIVMPNSYQVNYYPSLPPLASVGRQPFVFANYNKIDKLEPEVFSVWMAILRRVPSSELWLLGPKGTKSTPAIKQHLQAEACAHGVAPSRLRFLGRVSKQQHLERQQEADLFLDTFLYGAHSTATDALVGGLPVLTLAGDTFASRVGVSLLANTNQLHMIAHSKKEFEDVAVYLATHVASLRELRRHVVGQRQSSALFQTSLYTFHLEHAYSMVYELYLSDGHRRHLVVPP